MAKKADPTPFLAKLAATLRSVGMDAKVTYESLKVGEVVFPETEATKQSDHVRVKFLESSFKVTGTDEEPVFDLQRAVGMVISDLPKRLAGIEAQKKYKANRAEIAEFTGAEGKYIENDRFAMWFQHQPGVQLAAVGGAIVVRIGFATVEEAKAALTKLGYIKEPS